MPELPAELVPLRAGRRAYPLRTRRRAYGGIRASSQWSRGCGDARLEEIEEGTSDNMRLITSRSM
ncbi:hypothetical protein ACH492_04125 [Streptomyces sp. NPDC019443]|uniref:hypothetical protein n=1 Tax=Streptomyces sp. NPDC019443 TaxID=3365061 RepID=UPI0037A277AF